MAFSSQMCQILKCSYYKNYCIDYNQILQNNRDPQVLTVGGPNVHPNKYKMADSRHLEKSTNLNIFTTAWLILTKFGMPMRLYPLGPVSQKISRFLISKMAAAAILKIWKIAVSPQRNDRFWRNLIQWCVWALQTLSANKILQFQKSKIKIATVDKNSLYRKRPVIQCISRIGSRSRGAAALVWYTHCVLSNDDVMLWADVIGRRAAPPVSRVKPIIRAHQQQQQQQTVSASDNRPHRPSPAALKDSPLSGGSQMDTVGNKPRRAVPVPAQRQRSRTFSCVEEIPSELSGLSAAELSQCVVLLGVSQQTADLLSKHRVDGQQLSSLTATQLTHQFQLTPLDANKLARFSRGWRPTWLHHVTRSHVVMATENAPVRETKLSEWPTATRATLSTRLAVIESLIT